MIAVTTIFALVGVILGLRFRILILVPATVVGSVSVFAGCIAQGYDIASILITIALAITASQTGYFAGAVAIHLVVRSRGRKQNIVAVAQRR